MEMMPRVAFIVASGPAIQAARIAKGVTVLFAISGDPVELGIAQTLARPGGNFTGSTFLSLEIAAKRVELLKEAFPRMRTLAMLSNTNHPGESSERRATEAAARALGVSTVHAPFAAVGGLDGALTAIRDARPDAMVVFPDGSTIVNREKIAQFAAGQRLPSMFGWAEYCGAGGLMCYGANQREAYVRLAAYADRLLRGIKAADIPIEQPTKFELVINTRTARAIGLTIPPTLLLRADQVIE
jgi:putative ABC transport system substrate-binding protein